MLKYKINHDNENIQVDFKGDLDIEGTEIINDELIPKMLSYKKVNIDFKNVPFVDSSGMGLLITLVQTLRSNGISVYISNIQKDVYEIFEILQIPEILGQDVLIKVL